MTVWVACKFREGDTRTYSYAYDGEEVFEAGDKVRVPDRSGDGWKVVIVDHVHHDEPPFTCKAVIGRHVEEPKDEELPLD